MANDGTLAMHAVLRKVHGASNAQGKKTYKMAFSYPLGFVAPLADFLGEDVDVYWNDDLVAHNALLTDTRQKAVKDSDPDCLMFFDADAKDSELMNGAHQVEESGDLRLVVKQMALRLQD